MIWKLSVLVLLCSVIVLVKSESYIEVDENGDEYEIKKFYIQGRQLNDAPQCVVTRKRRGIDTSRQYNVEPVYDPMDEALAQHNEDAVQDVEDNEEEEEDDVQDVIRVGDTGVTNNDMKSNITDAGVLIDDMKNSEDSKPIKQPTKSEAEPSLMLPQMNKENKEKEEKVETFVAVHKVPTKNKLQKVTIIRPQTNEETSELLPQKFQIVTNNPGSGNTADNEVIVINALKPQVHLSLESLLEGLQAGEDYDGDLPPFSWSYSHQPISTSAIWSTGENIDDSAFNKIYNAQNADEFPEEFSSSDSIDPDYPPMRPSRPAGNRPPKKNSHPNKRRKVAVRRPVKNNRPDSPNRRPMRNGRPGRPVRRPQSAKRKSNKKQNSVANRPTGRPSNVLQPNQTNNRNKNKNSNKRKSNKPSNLVRKKNKRPTEAGFISSEYTRSVTQTDNDSKIDCIIINKDREVPAPTTTTSTTPRPFWNIFGRRASNTAQSRNFGNRKRVNLRFNA